MITEHVFIDEAAQAPTKAPATTKASTPYRQPRAVLAYSAPPHRPSPVCRSPAHLRLSAVQRSALIVHC